MKLMWLNKGLTHRRFNMVSCLTVANTRKNPIIKARHKNCRQFN